MDFAFWCTYKYLNGGPGSTGALYVNQKHDDVRPGLAGWWGYKKDEQFDMNRQFRPADGASAWQIGTVPVLSTAPVLGALKVISEAGIERIREKSLRLTEYLIDLLAEMSKEDSNFTVGTPDERERRGGHVAVEHPEASRICKALKDSGIIVDFRPPRVIRMAPSPLYTRYVDVYRAVTALIEIENRKLYRDYSRESDPVS